MRTPAKVQSLRAHEIDGGEKNAGSQTHLARAVTLHLAGKREEARSRSGGRTSVPQIFIDGKHIGGSDEMSALEAAGKLDAMLAA